ncbi:hypothetical protein MG296_12085 [Flavobacteriaceae bacterium TK19130]|nr:hypothetical protein [Thermobacterium salinum]
MKNQETLVHDEMRKLIKKSCAADQLLNPHYYSFQKSLLKFFFNAAAITIDYDEKEIALYKGQDAQGEDSKLFDLSETSTIKISYDNLEETLKGCLEKGHKPIHFYKSQLFHYNRVADVITEEPISA